MPYVLVKDPKKKNNYWVVTQATGVKHSLKSLPLARAEAQMRLLYAVEHGYALKKKRSRKAKNA